MKKDEKGRVIKTPPRYRQAADSATGQ